MPKRQAPPSSDWGTSEWERRKKFRGRGQRQLTQYTGWQPRAFQTGEWKYLDTAINMNMNQTGYITLLNGLQPGSAATQRIGMKISIKSIEFKAIGYVTAGTGVDQFHRFIILLDRQTNGAGPTALTDFLSTGDVLGLRNLAARRRFKILMDKRYYLNATGEPDSGIVHNIYIKFRKPIIVEYNTGSAGTVADIVTNSLHMVTVGNIAAGTTAGAITGNLRIRYTDL